MEAGHCLSFVIHVTPSSLKQMNEIPTVPSVPCVSLQASGSRWSAPGRLGELTLFIKHVLCPWGREAVCPPHSSELFLDSLLMLPVPVGDAVLPCSVAPGCACAAACFSPVASCLGAPRVKLVCKVLCGHLCSLPSSRCLELE